MQDSKHPQKTRTHTTVSATAQSQHIMSPKLKHQLRTVTMSSHNHPTENVRPTTNTSNKHLGNKPMHSSKTASSVKDKDASAPSNKPGTTTGVLGMYPMPLGSTVYPANDHTVPVSENVELNDSSAIGGETLPGRYQGYGSRIPYAKFCAEYSYTFEFPETVKPRDQAVQVQSIPEADLIQKGLRSRLTKAGNFEKGIDVRVPGAEEAKFVVVSSKKTAFVP
jgi:hypothetical protein